MVHIVWIVGVLTALCGVLAIFKPNWMKAYIRFISRGRLFYGVIALKIVIGILFLIFARECKLPWAIIAVGILSAVGAAVFGLLPVIKIKAYLNWWQIRPDWMYRVWGILAIAFGLLIMYIGFPK
mgnify:CR=1 FL=1